MLLVGEIITELEFTDEAKDEYAKVKSTSRADDIKGNPIYKQKSVNGGGLLVMGKTDGSGTVRIGVITVSDNVQSVWWVPICWGNNHAMCGDSATCWGFVCIPKQQQGGPCTHDIHCLKERCGDERGALWCVDCTQDDQCGNGEFCDYHTLSKAAYLTCRQLVSCETRRWTCCETRSASSTAHLLLS